MARPMPREPPVTNARCIGDSWTGLFLSERQGDRNGRGLGSPLTVPRVGISLMRMKAKEIHDLLLSLFLRGLGIWILYGALDNV